MSIDALMTLPCTVTPRSSTSRDANNDEVWVDGTPFETVCWRARVSGREQQTPDNVVVGDWHFYFPADTDLTLLDAQAKVACRGAVHEMVVEPWLAENPRSDRGEHVEAFGRVT